MGFTDLMSSSRGPGVIGTLMALMVLIGFGILFVFAFDEGLQGGDRSIESIIATQTREIDEYQVLIRNTEATVAEAPAREEINKELNDVLSEARLREGTLDGMSKNVTALHEQIEERLASFDAYKEEYRLYVRRSAVGEKIEELTTLDGRTYNDVEIRAVDGVGILVRHEDGQQRIPFENVSEELRDRFQYDPTDRQAAIAKEQAQRAEVEQAVALANEAMDAKLSEQRQQELEKAKQDLVLQIAAKEQQIKAAEAALRDLEQEYASAQAAAAAARSSGRRFIDRSGSLARSVSQKKTEIGTLRAELARLRSRA